MSARVQECDVCIIGSGISAAMVAERLVREGKSNIVVLEADGRHHPEDQRHHTRKQANAEENLLGGWEPAPLLKD
jgi:choline dehydrogenase-like flavoprotein